MSTDAAPRHLAALPAPPPRPDPAQEAANRGFSLYFAEQRAREEAATRAQVLATALRERDQTIAALTARVGRLVALGAAGWVAAGTLALIFALHLLGGR